MITQIVILLNLLVYSFIVSQSFSYIIALDNVQKNLSVGAYIELRKLLDKNFRAKFKIVFYAALITGPLTIILASKLADNLLLITSVIAFAAFVADTILMLKGNMPINNLINTWSTEKYPADWTAHRDKWLAIFRLRQVMNITGFVALLAGVVFG